MRSSGEKAVELELAYNEESLCFRIPQGLPAENQEKGNLAISGKCKSDVVEEGEFEVWFWLEKVKRIILLRPGGEEQYTFRYWKDVRWFAMRGEGSVEVSAGGFPTVCEEGEIFAYLIKPAGKENFALPKGLIDRGETPEEAAAREVREETGLSVEAGPLITRVNYFYKHPESGQRIYKEVFYFFLKVKRGSTQDHDWEVSEVIKVPLQVLHEKLKYSSEKKGAVKLLEKVKSGEITVC